MAFTVSNSSSSSSPSTVSSSTTTTPSRSLVSNVQIPNFLRNSSELFIAKVLVLSTEKNKTPQEKALAIKPLFATLDSNTQKLIQERLQQAGSAEAAMNPDTLTKILSDVLPDELSVATPRHTSTDVMTLVMGIASASNKSQKEKESELIAFLSSHCESGDLDAIYNQIFIRSKDLYKMGGKEWGKAHIADNLDLLIDVLSTCLPIEESLDTSRLTVQKSIPTTPATSERRLSAKPAPSNNWYDTLTSYISPETAFKVGAVAVTAFTVLRFLTSRPQDSLRSGFFIPV